MPIPPTVDYAFTETRSFYASGKKSSNKVYTLSTDEVIPDADWAQYRAQWEVRMMAAYRLKRNENRDISSAERPPFLPHSLPINAAFTAVSTPAQSPRRGCRNCRRVGYHGLSSVRSRIHRQSVS